MKLENKKVTIIGAVRSGEAAALLLKKLGAIPFVSDMASQEKIEKAVETF
ncbi:partial UDP-N-acetylmuramoylalanine--D-glutamate ligase, partial [Candidatus Brocadiaceae bacterium]